MFTRRLGYAWPVLFNRGGSAVRVVLCGEEGEGVKLINNYQVFQCELCGQCFFTSRGAKKHEANHIKRIKKEQINPGKVFGILLFKEGRT